MKKLAVGTLRTIKRTLKILAIGLTTTLIVFVALVVWVLNEKPKLDVWHTVHLDAEFTEESEVKSFDDYLALEERLFDQLKSEVLDKVKEGKPSALNRYQRGTRSDPARWPVDWNRTFERAADDPKAGVLLIHGMSDSPYSLRTQAEKFGAAGAWVVGLRVPGHGTAPSGLVHATYEDMAAAVRLAVRHLRERIGDRPLYLVGYSNGGALSVHYALTAVEAPELPQVDGIMLMSPAIGVTPAAALAIWQERIGRLLGLDKLKWNSVGPEYDPFKYASFAVNAGNQSYRISMNIQERMSRLREAGKLKGFPKVIAFQSAVDATVSIADLITVLMDQLPEEGHELVIFDVNRMTESSNLLKEDPEPKLRELLADRDLPFTLTVITNESASSRRTVVQRLHTARTEVQKTPLGIDWPIDLFSVSHIALPFPPTDPLYGNGSGNESPGVHIGQAAMRGERGVLAVSASDMLRIRWNPFHPYVERRMLEFTGLGEPE
ncbi:MAG: alpha/beta hydrolase [Planctomycetota bacterium]|jgi:alpha-beta hydrolase superfamily lysophospholipase